MRRWVHLLAVLIAVWLLGGAVGASARPVGVPAPPRLLDLRPSTPDLAVLSWQHEPGIRYRLCVSAAYDAAGFVPCFKIGAAGLWPVHVPEADGQVFYLGLQACRDGDCTEPLRAGAIGRRADGETDFYATAFPREDGHARLSALVRSGSADLRFYRGTAGTAALLDTVCTALGSGEVCGSADVTVPGALVGVGLTSGRGQERGITIQIRDTPHIAFTFDDGTGVVTDGKYAVQRILDQYGVKGSFFLTGRAMQSYPAAVRALVAAGHRVGNHTWTHPYLTKLSDAAIGQELDLTEAQFRATVPGGTLRPCFRAPNGDLNDRVLAVAAGRGYRQVFQNVDTNDWAGSPAAQIVDHVLASARDGAVASFHTQERQTLLALPSLIPMLLAEGFQFVLAC